MRGIETDDKGRWVIDPAALNERERWAIVEGDVIPVKVLAVSVLVESGPIVKVTDLTERRRTLDLEPGQLYDDMDKALKKLSDDAKARALARAKVIIGKPPSDD